MTGQCRRAHAAAAVEMAAGTVHLVKQLLAVRNGELVSLKPPSDRVRRSDAVGKKARDGNLVGSATPRLGQCLVAPPRCWWRRQAPRQRRSAGAARWPPV